MSGYGENGKWRSARKEHRCDYNHGASNGGRCVTVIRVGDPYFDTVELNGSGGGFATDRICAGCALALTAKGGRS